MILLTQSRTCILLSIFIFLAYLCPKLLKISNKWIILAFALPFLSMIFQILFPDFFENIKILGESADTGRINLWLAFYNSTSFFDLVFGDISTYGGANMHNSYLSIIASFGIIVLIFFIIFLKKSYSYYYKLLQRDGPNSQKIAFWGMLCVIVHGCSEATFLVSGAVFAGLVGLLLILALPDRSTSC